MKTYQIDGLCYIDPVNVHDEYDAFDVIKPLILESLRSEIESMLDDDVMINVFREHSRYVDASKSLDDLQELFDIFEIV